MSRGDDFKSFDSVSLKSDTNVWPKKHSYGEAQYNEYNAGGGRDYSHNSRRGYNSNRYDDVIKQYGATRYQPNNRYNEGYGDDVPYNSVPPVPYTSPYKQGARSNYYQDEKPYRNRQDDGRLYAESVHGSGSTITRDIIRRKNSGKGSKPIRSKCCTLFLKVASFLLTSAILTAAGLGIWYYLSKRNAADNKNEDKNDVHIGRFSSNVIFENVLYKPEYSDMSIQDEIFVKFEQDYCSKINKIFNKSIAVCHIDTIVKSYSSDSMMALTSLHFKMGELNRELNRKGLLTQIEVIVHAINNHMTSYHMTTEFVKSERKTMGLTLSLDMKLNETETRFCHELKSIFPITSCSVTDTWPAILCSTVVSFPYVKNATRSLHLQFSTVNVNAALTGELKRCTLPFFVDRGFVGRSDLTYVSRQRDTTKPPKYSTTTTEKYVPPTTTTTEPTTTTTITTTTTLPTTTTTDDVTTTTPPGVVTTRLLTPSTSVKPTKYVPATTRLLTMGRPTTKSRELTTRLW